ncbi:hypothetical protein F350042L8_33200 [Fusobacterium ulcerans]|uniref:hypothetical protein n=1 Tax=Fusobacterium ulcerans TaxID=861 RepID=UPI0034A9F97C
MSDLIRQIAIKINNSNISLINEPFNQIFNENFMKKYTSFSSISELMTKYNITNLNELKANIHLLEIEEKVILTFLFEEYK